MVCHEKQRTRREGEVISERHAGRKCTLEDCFEGRYQRTEEYVTKSCSNEKLGVYTFAAHRDDKGNESAVAVDQELMHLAFTHEVSKDACATNSR